MTDDPSAEGLRPLSDSQRVMEQIPFRSLRLRTVSKKRAGQQDRENKLKARLIELCGRCCEVCGIGARKLWKHEIVFRSRGGDPTDELNCIMACIDCHNHRKYPKSGTPLSTERQLEIARNRSA